jgi:3-oxoadipate enol-lactonase
MLSGSMKARIAGAELGFDTCGSGPAVILLHAFPLHRSSWDGPFESLGERFTVVRFDARGFGESEPGDSLLTMERLADDAVAVLDHLGKGRAVACGVSMGGYAALALARRHPGRLSGLVLSDTRAEADSADARKSRAAQAESVRREGTRALVDAMLPRVLGATTRASRPEVVRRVRDMMMQARPRAVTDALAGLGARADCRPFLREIRVPTLVVCGSEDGVTPPSAAETLRAGIAHSRLELLADAGHFANMETPLAWTEIVRRFLDGVPPW